MKRRSFLAFLGMAPAAPLVGRAVAAIPAVAAPVSAVAPAITPAAVAASAAALYTMAFSVSVCEVESIVEFPRGFGIEEE